MVHVAYSDMPAPLLCTHTSAKFPREARQATSPSSSTTTRRPRRASPQATAIPTSPPPTTAKSYSLLVIVRHYKSARALIPPRRGGRVGGWRSRGAELSSAPSPRRFLFLIVLHLYSLTS